MNELDKIAPGLSKMKRKLPYKIPENYFDEFPERLQQRVNKEEITPVLHRSRIIQFIKPAIGIAASLTIAALIIYSLLRDLPSGNQTASNSVTLTEEEGLITFIEKIDESSFFSLIEESLPEEEDELYEEELLSYICSNMSEYEIYLENNN
jgi:hypothetical protein